MTTTPHQRLTAALETARVARAAAREADHDAAEALCDIAHAIVPLEWRPEAPGEVPPRCYVDLPSGRVYVTRMPRGWEAWAEPDAGPCATLQSLTMSTARDALSSLHHAATVERSGSLLRRVADEVVATLAPVEAP